MFFCRGGGVRGASTHTQHNNHTQTHYYHYYSSSATGALLVTTAFVALRSYAASNAGAFSLPDVLRGFGSGVLDCLRPKNAAAGFYGLQALCSLAGFAVLAVAGATPLFAAPVGAATAFLAQVRWVLLLLLLLLCRSSARRAWRTA